MKRLICACACITVLAGAAVPLLAATAAATTAPPTANATAYSVSLPAAPVPSTTNGFLNSVSCTSSSFCVAVGESGTAGLLEQWDGSSWAIVDGPSLSSTAYLNGVSCVGPSFCSAVGQVGSDALAEQWNGATWSQVPTPPPSGVTSSFFSSVSCAGASDCVAVGTTVTSGVDASLIEQWNGTTWSIMTSPAPSGSSGSQLRGVSCTSSTSCMAVGLADVGTALLTLAEHWDGSSWSIVTTPNPSPQSTTTTNELSGVSCIGSDFCEAVGNSDASSTDQTLIESWNGSTWSLVASPNSSTTEGNLLEAVDCFSETTCTATGFALTPTNAFGPLAVSWDGTSWALATTPTSTDYTQSEGAGVSCITNWECVSVGTYTNDGTPDPFGMTAPIARSGYRFVAADGGIFSYGSGAPFLGSEGGQKLNKPIVGMAVMPGGDGYYLVASDGGIFNFGSARFDGSAGNLTLNKPIVGMAVTADGGGYYLVASDGGLFAYGDAQFYGSMGGKPLNAPIVGMAITPDGKGYYEVASDGGIFSFGDATFQGSAGSLHLNKPVVGMSVPTSGGYYLVASDGGIFSYPSSLPFYGSTGSIKLNQPVVSMAAVQGGYYFTAADGGVFAYPSSLPFLGSMGGKPLNAAIVGMTS